MTNREQELLQILRQNPAISQNELAELLGITRSSVAVHITNLTKKGYILGKGYILKQEEYALVLGGANVDIIGLPNNKLIARDSNPGRIEMTMGGVGRNIAENLVHLGTPTKLLTAIGDDVYGRKMLEHSGRIGLDMKDCLVLHEQPTSTYLAILDENGDMVAAVNQMDIIDSLGIDYIQSKKTILENARVTVIDTNVREDVIRYVLDNVKNTDFFLDTVSTRKAMKVKDRIGAFHTIKPNRIEAELLSGVTIRTTEDMRRAAEVFLEKGVRRVFITLGTEGVYYHDGTTSRHIPNPPVEVVNATGAGDAFVAGLVYGHMHGYDADRSARYAMATAILTLESKDTINPNLSEDSVQQKIKETELC